MTKLFKPVAIFLSLFFALGANANVKVPFLFANGMVLQRNKPITIWGWADANETVAVSFAGKKYQSKAGEDRRWKIETRSLSAGGPYQMVITGKNTITISDILIGEVWLCSGQSNMGFVLERAKEKYKDEIANGTNPNIRQIALAHTFKFRPAEDAAAPDGWLKADPKNLLKFTAVGYFFAKQLYEKYKVPIGLIHSSWGGTPAQSWTSTDGLKPFPDYYDRAQAVTKPDKVAQIHKNDSVSIATWKASGSKTAPKPTNFSIWPATLYNGMISPLLSYKIKGVIWYQGEANAHKAKEYETLFPAMIRNWRINFKQGDFPFLFVQLANYLAVKGQPSSSDWAMLRNAQTMALQLPKTGMAVIHDIGEAKDIHPHNKRDVGFRLASLADKVAYGKTGKTVSGPMFKSMEIKKDTVIISFSNIGGRLIAKGGAELKHFAIAGPDQQFVWAKATISNNKVHVYSDKVKQPVAVRYAWADNPEGANLANKEGFLAPLFRTDEWGN